MNRMEIGRTQESGDEEKYGHPKIRDGWEFEIILRASVSAAGPRKRT